MLLKHRIQVDFKRVLLLALAITTAVLAISSPSFAATANNNANTLKVSPVRSDIEILPGATKTVDVYVTNLTDTPISIRPIENDFIAGDERGTPALILDADKYAPTHSLKRFMSPLADVTIPAKETKTITVVITVPKDAQAGGYFGALRLAPTSPDGSGQVNLSASVASLILLSVPGETVEKLDLTEFKIEQNNDPGEFFRTPDNLQVSFRFQNNGSVQLGPFGKLSVLQGDRVVYSTDFNTNDPRDMVLPDSARRWEMPLEKIGTLGYYTVKATFTYGKTNQAIEVTKSFWVVPLWAIITAIVGLLVLIGLVIAAVVFLRRRMSRTRNNGGSSLRIK